MKIFISSVRNGLEEERDALAGLITALGHTPVRFEDFAARAVALKATDPEPRGGWHDIRPSRFQTAYLHKSGQVGLTFTLPADQMSSFLDRDDTVQNVTRALHLVHRMEYVSTPRSAVALRVTQASCVTVGPVPGASRSSMTMAQREDVIELIPVESILTAALGSAAGEIAANSVDALLRKMR